MNADVFTKRICLPHRDGPKRALPSEHCEGQLLCIQPRHYIIAAKLLLLPTHHFCQVTSAVAARHADLTAD